MVTRQARAHGSRVDVASNLAHDFWTAIDMVHIILTG
jgi:hypothetical protein